MIIKLTVDQYRARCIRVEARQCEQYRFTGPGIGLASLLRDMNKKRGIEGGKRKNRQTQRVGYRPRQKKMSRMDIEKGKSTEIERKMGYNMTG